MLKKLFLALSAKNISTGSLGEEKACLYLKKNGYSILERNWKSHPYELDIICFDKQSGELVFVEVKTSTNQEKERALEAFTSKKQNNIIKGASKYLTQKNKWDYPCRFDLICVYGETQSVEHFINVITQ